MARAKRANSKQPRPAEEVFNSADWMSWAETIECVERAAGGWPGAQYQLKARLDARDDLRVIDRYTGPDGKTESRQLPADISFNQSMRQFFSTEWARERRERGGGHHQLLAYRADVQRHWPIAAEPASANNPRGAGSKQKFDRELILIEAAAYVLKNDLPKSVEELAHELQLILGRKMAKDTQAKIILGAFYRKMQQVLGR